MNCRADRQVCRLPERLGVRRGESALRDRLSGGSDHRAVTAVKLEPLSLAEQIALPNPLDEGLELRRSKAKQANTREEPELQHMAGVTENNEMLRPYSVET